MTPRPTKKSRGVPGGKRVGLANYRKEDWLRWLEVVDDTDQWEDTYEKWKSDVDAMADRLRRAGLELVWVDLEPDKFSEWCKACGYRNDGEARSRFAAEQIGNMPPSNPKQANP